MKNLISAILIILATTTMASAAPPPAKLKPKTVEAFDEYIRNWEKTEIARTDSSTPFLWIDSQSPQLRQRLLNGEIITHHFKKDTGIPSGMIHNWLGAVFIPGGSITGLAALLQNFDRHKEIYPEATESKALGNDEEKVWGFLRLKNKRFVTVVLNTEHEQYLSMISDHHYTLKSYSTRIQEVKNPETPNEIILEPGQDRGFLWRMNAYWRLQEVDGGIMVECNMVSLSRGIPWIIAWLIKPIIAKFPGEALKKTLEKTRQVARVSLSSANSMVTNDL